MNSFRALGPAILLLLALSATPATAATNVAPVITGTPATTVTAGSRYRFRPTASDANGNRISFRISGKPAWATFNRYNGEFTGIAPAGLNATFANIVVSASDGRLSTALPAFSIRVTSGVTNAAPTITGSPATSVLAAAAYSFRPSATDANGDALSFSIQNKPAWANFSISTGQLSGTAPATAASTPGILISVSDGKVSAALPAFTINVTAPTSGVATLSWVPPTRNTDGSALSDLAGYRLYFGSSPSSLTQVLAIAGAGTMSHVVTNLGAGTWYFALTARTSTGLESALSSVVSKAIP